MTASPQQMLGVLSKHCDIWAIGLFIIRALTGVHLNCNMTEHVALYYAAVRATICTHALHVACLVCMAAGQQKHIQYCMWRVIAMRPCILPVILMANIKKCYE